MKKFVVLSFSICILVSLSGCWLKGGTGSGLKFKRITPRMEKQMEYVIRKGCKKEYKYLDRDIAVMYSLLPGGGQFYTGETKKGFLYLLSFPLVVPYFISFIDAQNSVDYYNFRYTLYFCKRKLGITGVFEQPEIVIEKRR